MSVVTMGETMALLEMPTRLGAGSTLPIGIGGAGDDEVGLPHEPREHRRDELARRPYSGEVLR
jgi:hypothetical protein